MLAFRRLRRGGLLLVLATSCRFLTEIFLVLGILLELLRSFFPRVFQTVAGVHLFNGRQLGHELVVIGHDVPVHP